MTSNQVLTQSVLRVGAFLGLSHAELTQTLGLDLCTISAMADGSAELDGNTVSGRRSLTLIRIHKALIANVGPHEEACKQWVCSHNASLGGTPALLMHTEMGMEAVLAYLQSMGAPQGM